VGRSAFNFGACEEGNLRSEKSFFVCLWHFGIYSRLSRDVIVNLPSIRQFFDSTFKVSEPQIRDVHF